MVVFASNNSPLVRTGDGRNFELQEAVIVQRDDGARFRVPVGAFTDGASTPCELWPTLPPFGPWWLAALVHDSAYRGSLQRQLQDGGWAPAMLSKDESDFLFMDCMIALGVEEVPRGTLYDGVRLLGWRAFRENRK
jgi:hypothetical protein